MHLKSILFVAALALAASAKPFPRSKRDVTNCGSSSDILKLTSLTLSPNPPQRGQNLTVIATGTLTQAIINGSTINVNVTLDSFLPVLSNTWDLCSEAAQEKITCPMPSGAVNLTTTLAVPSDIPSGSYAAHAVASEPNGSEIACFDITFSF
ncbi:MD-2-related lipid-recognition domain-containing protein [Endogone sp. FLAS-F59071]|nr:MD-2-related lipid-recognition domain-containing protein [Endogone sp. FLAS-F59071]|eukprot:RUS20379.1 MD-2-related lipid-recognition domain-containing protein [Endogone sp. FLAS-F59071]